MSDLEDWPDHFVLFLSFVRGIFGILELVGEFEQSVFDVFEAVGRRLAVSGAADRRHSCSRDRDKCSQGDREMDGEAIKMRVRVVRQMRRDDRKEKEDDGGDAPGGAKAC